MDEQNETVVVVRNQRSAGRGDHWLIIPKMGEAVRHIRDIEALTREDVPLRMSFSCEFPRSFPINKNPFANEIARPICSQGNEQDKKRAPQEVLSKSLA